MPEKRPPVDERPASDLAAPADMLRAWRTMLEAHSERIDDLGRALRAEHKLTVSEFDVLINIGSHEACRHGELAGRVVLSRSALTRLIDRLIDRGYLVRDRATGDSRGVLISLTDAGRAARRAASRTNSAVVTRALAGLTLGETRELERLMQKLLHNEA